MPLRYCMPLRQFVWLNRTVIKITHLPILACIFVYERFFLASSMYEPTDLVENPGRSRRRGISLLDPASRTAVLNPTLRLREESMVGFQKDRALEEVFRLAPDFATSRSQRRSERRRTQHQVRSWIERHEGDYPQSPRQFSTINSRPDRLYRRQSMNRERPERFRHLWDVRSAASDPAELYSNTANTILPGRYSDGIARRDYAVEANNNTDADGDDELLTNDEDEEDNGTNSRGRDRHGHSPIEEDYFTTPIAARYGTLASTSHGSSAGPTMSPHAGPPRRQGMHSRTLSNNTILFAPQEPRQRARRSSSASIDPFPHARSRPLSTRNTAVESPGVASGRRSPRRPMYLAPRPRTFHGSHDYPRMAQNRPLLHAFDIASQSNLARRHSSFDVDTLSELGGVMEANADVAASFAEHIATRKSAGAGASGGADRLNRAMLAKMMTLEDSMAEMVREMRGLRSAGPSTARESGDEHGSLRRAASGSSGGLAVVEVAGSRKVRATAAGRGWGGRSGAVQVAEGKGKGKARAVAAEDTDEDVGVGRLSGLDGGSSFGRGSSL